MAAQAPPPGTDRPTLPEQLERWVGRGLISAEQAERILAEEQPAGEGPARGSLVAEALGYVGGVLILVGAITVVERFWSDIGVGGRLGVAFGAAGLLFATGAGVPARRTDVARRLRSVCWVLSAALLGTGLALLGDDVLHLDGESSALLATGVTAGYAAVLWWRHRAVLQQAALVVAIAAAAGTAAAHLPDADDAVTGLAVWGVGAAWVLLGWGGVVAARHPAYVLGGAVAVVGGLFCTDTGWGSVIAVASAAALVVAGVRLRDLVLLVVGSVATLVIVPTVLGQYFPDTLTVPLALLGCGVLLVAGAVYTAYRRRLGPPDSRRTSDTRTVSVAAAAGLAVAVMVAVLVLGW